MNRTHKYFISHLLNPVSQSEREDLYYRVNNMAYKELCSLYKTLGDIEEVTHYGEESVYDWDFLSRLLRHMRSIKRQYEGGNKSIKRLIAEYKASCAANCTEEIMEISNELVERFAYQSFEEQKLIFKTLIRSEYRLDAYNLLNDTWAEMFVKELQRQWLKDDDTNLIRYIIRYSSEEFLLKHLAKLQLYDSDYAELCVRLGNNPSFTIDKHRFYDRWDYYAAMYRLNREIDGEYILRELFKVIEHGITNASKLYDMEICLLSTYRNSHLNISAKLIRQVNNAVCAMCDAKMSKELAYFYEWDSKIIRALGEYAKVWNKENGEELTFYQQWMKYCEIAIDNFPSEYSTYITWHRSKSNQRRETMLQELQPLIEEFDLKVADTTF